MYVISVYRRRIRMIDSIKEIVFATIKTNSCMEITNQTNYKNAGIYMIYIDNFSDDKIIPFYIGQTKNLQKRYKDHLSEIMALNRLDCDYYNALLVQKFYDGSLKACKMFKYMVDHECSLKDFHMIILENVNELDKLEQIEQEYFKLYHPAFFGFNQMNTRLAVNNFIWGCKPEEPYNEDEYVALCDIVSDDICNIYKYKEYGFTLFNFKWAFIKQLPNTDGKNIESIRSMIDDVNERLDRLREDLLCPEEKIAEARENELDIKLKELRNVEGEIVSRKRELKNSLIIPKAQKLFEDNNIKSNTAYQDFLDSLLCNNEKAKKSFLKYLDKRKIHVNFYREFQHELIEKESIDCELRKYEVPIDAIQEELSELSEKRMYETIKIITPDKEYEKFPLKDMYNDYVFQYAQKYKANFCEINMAISNNGRNKQPEIIKIDFKIVNDNKVIERKNIFIDNSSTESCYNKQKHYYEKDHEDYLVFKKVPFKLGLWDCRLEDWSDVFISINAETRTGINDYTLKDRKLYELKDVFNDIALNTNEHTLFIPIISESASCLQSSFYDEDEDTLKLNPVKALLKIRKK